MEKDAAEGKKPGQGPENGANQETFLEEQRAGEDPQSQDTIRYFVRDHLVRFHQQMEAALDLFEAYVRTQTEDVRAAFEQRGFFDFIGQRFEEELLHLGGGSDRPLASTLVREVHNAVAFAEHSCFDLGTFVNNAFRRGVRDACWYIRDAVPSILDAHWSNLLKLAAGGGNQFIPALYSLGFPRHGFDPNTFAETLRLHAEGYRRAMNLGQRKIAEQMPVAMEQEQMDVAARKDMLEQGRKPATL